MVFPEMVQELFASFQFHLTVSIFCTGVSLLLWHADDIHLLLRMLAPEVFEVGLSVRQVNIAVLTLLRSLAVVEILFHEFN